MPHYVCQNAKNVCLIRNDGNNTVQRTTIYDSPTVEQFLNFFTELFNQVESHSVPVFSKNVAAHVFRMKYQHISQYPSVIKYFKLTFNLRPSLPKLSFLWDVQIVFKYFRNLGDNSQISEKHLP